MSIFASLFSCSGGRRIRRYGCLVLSLVLTGCSPPLTVLDAQATAVVAGCWPDPVATPRPVTVTPITTPLPTLPTSTVITGMPTLTPAPTTTPLPTTTPYPRCPPAPNATLIPWPTPVPPKAPFPTFRAQLNQSGSDLQTVMHLPGTILRLALAVHPTDGWPAVIGMTRFSESTEPIQAFVRVFNPHTDQWGIARQIDTGATSLGMDRFGNVAITITGDGTVVAAWGGSDVVPGAPTPAPSIWVATSRDFGATWSAPEGVLHDCWQVQDLASTPEGTLVLLAGCFVRAGDSAIGRGTLAVRQPGGAWTTSDLPIPATYGRLLITGSGAEARAVAFITAYGGAADPETLYLASRTLASTDPWMLHTRAWDVPVEPDAPVGNLGQFPQGVAYTRVRPDGSTQDGITVVWTNLQRATAYALTSLDGGRSWGTVESIVGYPGLAADTHRSIRSVTPAYDPVADRLLAIWGCCADSAFDTRPATHYASWSTPGSGVWTPGSDDDPLAGRVPLVTGAQATGLTVSAQAANSRVTWLAWIEQIGQIQARTLNLNQVLPVGLYPAPTPAPTATP